MTMTAIGEEKRDNYEIAAILQEGVGYTSKPFNTLTRASKARWVRRTERLRAQLEKTGFQITRVKT